MSPRIAVLPAVTDASGGRQRATMCAGAKWITVDEGSAR
jgi:hypothetical protein